MKICQIQFDIAWGNPQANCAHLDGLLVRAPQAELYVLRIVSMAEVFASIIHKVYNYEAISPDFVH